MGFWIDVIALIIVIICAGIAYYRGFVKTFFGFISTIVAILLASLLCRPVAGYIKNVSEMDEWIVNSVTSITDVNQEDDLNEEQDTMSDYEYIEDDELVETEEKEEPSDFLSFIDTLPETITDSLDFEKEKEELVVNLASRIADVVINILSWVIIYIIVKIILAVITFICDGIMSIPFLKTINNVAGLALGTLMGIFRIYLILAIIYFISNIANITGVVEAIQSSSVVSHLYNSNLLISLIF